MNLREMVDGYAKEGLSEALAASRVCQDIVLKALADGPLNRNVTIKGGVVMRSLTRNNRRATRDIDLDFIHYSIEDAAIQEFVNKLNCLDGIRIEISGEIKILKHQDYHGKSIDVVIGDENGNTVKSKIDIGVHKHLEIDQEEYCFDVCMDDEGVSLLKNTVEQAFVEKLRSLLKLGVNSRRYKDIYDMFYLKGIVSAAKMKTLLDVLIFNDDGIHERTADDIVRRLRSILNDELYLKRVSDSRQKWLDNDIHEIASGILIFIENLR